jgi:hypothetical protein
MGYQRLAARIVVVCVLAAVGGAAYDALSSGLGDDFAGLANVQVC